MVHAFHDAVLQRMAERPVSHVVKQDGEAGRFRFRLGDGHAFVPEAVDRFLHEVHASHGMVEAVVDRPGIYEVGQPQLRDATQALHVPVVHEVKGPFVAKGDKPVDRVVENFVAVDSAHPNTKSGVSTLLCRQASVTARDAARYAPSQRLETGVAFECKPQWDDHRFFGLTTRLSC